MLRRTVRRWCLRLAMTAAVTTALIITAIGAATAQPVSCKSRDLCLVKENGRVVVVGPHKKRTFKRPIHVVETINNESVVYCDLLEPGAGVLLFGAIPEGTQKVSETIVDVFPGPACPE
jgi:hypothetical protein